MDRQYGMNKKMAILCYQVLCGTIVAGAMHFSPGDMNSSVTPVVGGLMVGASQVACLLLTGRTLGGQLCVFRAVLTR
jgi:hypothetical protein